ncbi:MAG: lipocalin family protein [Bacteroidota bacterium]|nr:lipocalin family protein [Bacteroidota bacterium]
MERKHYILTGLALLAVAGFAAFYLKKKQNFPLEVVPNIDLDRYSGDWYEIARMPAPFEKGCYGTKAKYIKDAIGNIIVENTCNIGSPVGKEKRVKGKAFIPDKNNNAKLKVQFFWPFTGDYWILDIGKQYEYALVGEPTRKYLWILSRTESLEKSVIEQLVQKGINRGFNTHKLIFTRHLKKVEKQPKNLV